ncbi:MAG TPA: AsmA family protein [Candidatus Sulfotelmatobacter sp.]|nr:AsmA family protein [Candidatus Sulfotelmatobacter sp.]
MVAVVLLLLLFFLRPGASHLKSRIAGSMSAALGRPVEIGNVHFRLLPRPGFDLDSLVVHDDPSFGAEPILRASEVTADLRLASLLRGRIEISQLDLTEPSLNLVRDAEGRWNLRALLQRSAQIPLAPTAKAKSESRPGFPYIAASSGRINFKLGQEKKPYALTNADFTLWQESENSWGVRLKAQPMRSDLSLSDTGVLRVEGTWQRAKNLRETPLQFSLEWDRPQLGQLSKFVTGSDKGWRGTVLLDATVSGTPAELQISADGSIRDFRRYDISAGNALRLAAHCDAQYAAKDHAFHQLFCRAPVGDGAITLHGDSGLPGQHEYDLVAMAEHVPANALLALAERAKKNIPAGLTAGGELNGNLSFRAEGADKPMQAIGSGQIVDLRLASETDALDFGSIPFVVTTRDSVDASGLRPQTGAPNEDASGAILEFGPLPLQLGHKGTLTAQGMVDRSGFSLSVSGDADIPQTLRAARLVGIPALQNGATGDAQINLRISGDWALALADFSRGFAQSQITGTAKLHNVRAEVRGAASPIDIVTAEIQLLPSQVRIDKIAAVAAQTQWTGSVILPRGCGTPGACASRFNLNTNQTTFEKIVKWVHPQAQQRPWYKLLSPSTPAKSFFASLRASGTLSARRFQFHRLDTSHVSANLDLDMGQLRLTNLAAEILGGSFRGSIEADFSAKPAVYSCAGTLIQLSLSQTAELMKDPWISGVGSAAFKVSGSGADIGEFWNSAQGSMSFEMRNGTLPRFTLAEGSSLKFTVAQGTTLLREGKLEFRESVLNSPSGVYSLSGSATLAQQLDIKLSRSPMAPPSLTQPRGFAITGTLVEPRITTLTSLDTEAHLSSK